MQVQDLAGQAVKAGNCLSGKKVQVLLFLTTSLTYLSGLISASSSVVVAHTGPSCSEARTGKTGNEQSKVIC